MKFSTYSVISLALSLFVLFIFYSSGLFLSFSVLFFESLRVSFSSVSLGFSSTYLAMVFLVMLLTVTFLVLHYSESYMEHYNNYKFLVLIFMFFLSMATLSLSGTFLPLMMGWDYLGLTSICLIMMYPNKFTLFNSFLTMLFNRLGDVTMVLILCFLISYSNILYFSVFDSSLSFAFLVLLCSFTKSAQFPLSSWLPAAMSAPTPISAMVHSSTLVTAGIFLVCSMHHFFPSPIVSALCLISLITFLIGGACACSEMDLKKVIAFSTMSQISMILMFCSLSLYFLSLSHMVFHAFFKSLLFCCAGGLFFRFSMSQLTTHITSNGPGLMFLQSCVMLTAFAMSGLTFSSSFYTKDQILELIHEKTSFLYLLLLMGSVLTAVYIGKIFQNTYSSSRSFLYSFIKVVGSGYFLNYSLLVILASWLSSRFFFMAAKPLCEAMDVLLMSSLIILALTYDLVPKSPAFSSLSLEMYFMKWLSFSSLSPDINSRVTFFSLVNDHLFMKPSILMCRGGSLLTNLTQPGSVLLILMLLLIV